MNSSSIDGSALASGDAKSVKFCIRGMCECESGWHPSGDLIEYEQLANIPSSHYAYLYRIMNLIKITSMELDILSNFGKLEEMIEYIEDHFPAVLDETAPPPVIQSSQSSSYRSVDNRFTFSESYNALKGYLTSFLDQKTSASVLQSSALVDSRMNSSKSGAPVIARNPNRIDHFELNRCAMPSGKILWLCDAHSREEHVQVLTSTQEKKFTQYQNDEFNTILFDELRRLNGNSAAYTASSRFSRPAKDVGYSGYQVSEQVVQQKPQKRVEPKEKSSSDSSSTELTSSIPDKNAKNRNLN
jgi:hypothetical protein